MGCISLIHYLHLLSNSLSFAFTPKVYRNLAHWMRSTKVHEAGLHTSSPFVFAPLAWHDILFALSSITVSLHPLLGTTFGSSFTCNTPAVPCGVKKLQRRGCIGKVKRCEAGVSVALASLHLWCTTFTQCTIHLIHLWCKGLANVHRRCNPNGVEV